MTIHDSVDSHKFYNFRSQNVQITPGTDRDDAGTKQTGPSPSLSSPQKHKKRTSMAPHIQVTSYFRPHSKTGNLLTNSRKKREKRKKEVQSVPPHRLTSVSTKYRLNTFYISGCLLSPPFLSAESSHSARFRTTVPIHSTRFIAHHTRFRSVQVIHGRTGKTRCRVPRTSVIGDGITCSRVLVTPTPSRQRREIWDRGLTAIVGRQWHRALTR
mgnify:CR=1 FL=1